MSKANDFPPQDQTFVSHLIELRDRLLRAVLVVLIIFLGLFAFANDLYTFLAEPLVRNLPTGSTMIATGVISPFLTPFKLALVASIFISMPFILYQAWAFIAPGLYKNERRLVMPLVASSVVLFYLGMVFAYYVVFPLVFGFMATTTPDGVAQAPDISMYLDFAIKLFFAFGVAFEVPIATILLIWGGITTRESLAAKRPYIIVAAFVVGMLLTPPDVISQTLLALPMWILFELGLLLSSLYVKKEEDQESVQENEDKASEADTVAGHDTESEVSAYGEEVATDEKYQGMSEADMDAELDRIEAEEFEAEQDAEQNEESSKQHLSQEQASQQEYGDDEELYNNQDQEVHEEFEPCPEDDYSNPPASSDKDPKKDA
ncbi:twin-arginine translocase subunit TatC [Kaarinaea lacus]